MGEAWWGLMKKAATLPTSRPSRAGLFAIHVVAEDLILRRKFWPTKNVILFLPLAYQKVYSLQENKQLNSFERLEITVKMIVY